MKYTSSLSNSVLEIKIEGDLLGAENSLDLVEEINTAINNQSLYAVMDMSGVRYMNSSGIGLLVTLFTKYKNKSGNFAIINPTEQVTKLLVMTKLNTLIKTVLKSEEVKN
jgi:anti-sigma B factor antagonist